MTYLKDYIRVNLFLLTIAISACQTVQLPSQSNSRDAQTVTPLELELSWEKCAEVGEGSDNMIFDDNGSLWLSWLGIDPAPRAIVKMNFRDGKSSIDETLVDEPHKLNVLQSSMAPDGSIWFSTMNNIVQSDGETWQSYVLAPAGAYHDTAVAPNGDIWVGTIGPKNSGQGVFHFDGTTWTAHTINDGLAGNNVYQVEITQDGIVWLGTNNGVSRFDGKEWYTYPEMEGISVEDMVIASDGTIWLTSSEDVFHFDGHVWTSLYNTPDYNMSSSIEIAPDGTVWLHHSHSLTSFDGDDWTVHEAPSHVFVDDQDYIKSIAVDQDGVLWLSTNNGVFCAKK